MRIIDLSVALETGIASDPEMMLPKIQYQGHKETREQITAFFPGLKSRFTERNLSSIASHCGSFCVRRIFRQHHI